MTIINVGMCYQAEVLLKNKRKPSVVNVFTSIPVEIPDAKKIPKLIGISCHKDIVTEYREYNDLPIQPMVTSKFMTYNENSKQYILIDTEKELTNKNDIVNDLNAFYLNKTNDSLKNHDSSPHKKRFKGLSINNITADYILINDGMPNSDLPIICEDDISKIFSSNKTLKEKTISHYASKLLVVNNELYHFTSGPIFIKNMNKIHSFQKYYTICNDRTYQYSDISHTETNPLHQKKSIDMFTIDMFTDFLKADNKTDDELETYFNSYGIYIDNMEPFINANKNILGSVLFNYVFGDSFRENFTNLNENDISKLTKNYLNKLLTEYQYKVKEHSFSDTLKELYNDVIKSDYTYDKVKKMVECYFYHSFMLNEAQNKIPNGMGIKNKLYPSDSSISFTNRINNSKIIENLNKIHTYRELNNIHILPNNTGLTQ